MRQGIYLGRGRTAPARVAEERRRLTGRELLIVLEIGSDAIDSASAFVGYLSEAYGFSKSSIWYNLNSLKKRGVLDFASKEEAGKRLSLTKEGSARLVDLERQGMKLDKLESDFMSVRQPILQQMGRYGSAVARF